MFTSGTGTGSRSIGSVSLVLFLCLLLFGCDRPSAPAPSGAPLDSLALFTDGTYKMAFNLARLRRITDPSTDPYMNRERAVYLRQYLEGTPDPIERSNLFPLYAEELLKSGQSLEAVKVFQRFSIEQNDRGKPLEADQQRLLYYNLALSFLRLGEQENCLQNHTIDSCLFPIQGEGVHRLPRGSTEAVLYFMKILEMNPEDLSSRWLLNIAHMTLGQYPDQVPAEWLIPADVVQSPFPFSRFPDVAESSGTAVDGLCGGCVVEDFDRDGLLDIMVSSWDLNHQIRVLRNQGNGSFEDITEESGIQGITGGLNLIHADYDNDGLPDVMVLRGAWRGESGRIPNSLLKNMGSGRFADVTESAGLLSLKPTQTGVWIDYDNDGFLDLFIGNEATRDDIHSSDLYRNRGDGTFALRNDHLGAGVFGYVKAVAAGDYDNDGWADLYISRLQQPNLLLRNEGSDRKLSGDSPEAWFSERAEDAGVQEPVDSFPTWFWDFNNDGLLDIFVSDYGLSSPDDLVADRLGMEHQAAKAKLYQNLGNGKFEEVSQKVGLDQVLYAMGANFGDIDNDGFLDFYLGTGDPGFATLIPNRMFRNNQGASFQEITSSGGFGHLQKGHGIAFADLDNDGDQDIYEVIGGAYSGDNYRNVLFHNPGNQTHWINLELEGTTSNRSAIGARIRVSLVINEARQDLYRTVSTGGSFGSDPLRQHIGVGKAEVIDELEVLWPGSEQIQVFENIRIDRFYHLKEGEKVLQVINPIRFSFQKENTGTLSHEH